MSYVSKILQPGEAVRHTARINWLIYLPALILAFISLLVVAVLVVNLDLLDTTWRQVALLGAAAIGVIALVAFLRAWIERMSTELVVTDRRVIYKRGLIRRYTAEMNMEKVETVLVEQGIFGRLFNFGTVTIRGTGGGMEPMPNIDDPLTFRNHVTGT